MRSGRPVIEGTTSRRRATRSLALLAAIALAACEPKVEEPALDGAPTLEGGPSAADAAPGELAGGGPTTMGAVLPGVIGITPPPGMQPIENCERVIAADYDNPPPMTCVLFQAKAVEEGRLDAAFITTMTNAGWNFIRGQGSEYYFERPRAGTDCAELAAVSVITDRLPAVLEHAGAGAPPAGSTWQAYAIPASTRETCGADRMRP